MSQEYRLSLIREMERSGCDLHFHAETESRDCTLTVYWRGWQTSIVRMDVFDIERAYTEWNEYRDSVVYRVMTHQDQPRAAVRPQERARRSKRVSSRAGVSTPHVAAAVQQQTDDRMRSTLKERLKLRNQEAGAA